MINSVIEKLTLGCERECRIAYHGSTTTLLGYMQEYDKKGNPLGRDPNTTTSSYSCSECGKRWKIEHRFGNDVISYIEPAAETMTAPTHPKTDTGA